MVTQISAFTGAVLTTDLTALEDLAAEPDDPDNDPAGDDAGADPADPLHPHAGLVESGPAPYPGRLLVSRFPAGVLLLDKPAGRAWLLDLDPAGGVYRCRDTSGMPIDDAARWRAADGARWEVRAYDPDFTGDTAPGADEPCTDPGCDEDAGGGAA